MQTGKCRSCGAGVLWIKTAAGKNMPIDAQPAPDGNLIIMDGVARVVTNKAMLPTSPRYKSHFATCPNAVTHRKK